jgi:hypothetical protein
MSIVPDMRIIDPKEIFATNHFNWRIMHYEIGNSQNRIVTIRNFFKNPDLLREYAESVDYVDTINGQVSGIPGYIHRIGNGISTVMRPIMSIATNEFEASEDFVLENPHKFTFQIYPIDKECRKASLHPHTDNVRYAGVCSLNKDDEYGGSDNGTALWRNDTTLEEHTLKDFNYRAKRVAKREVEYVKLDPSTVDIPGWSIYHVIPHSYNTFVMYEGNMWHSPYFDLSKWKTNRLTFNCFLD